MFSEKDIISSYTRAQAIADGFLIDVSETAKECGFKYPVAVTAALWDNIESIPKSQRHQDVSGRLWDVLFMLFVAIKRKTDDGPLIKYRIIMHVGRKTYFDLKAVIGPGDAGEPVITIMLPNED